MEKIKSILWIILFVALGYAAVLIGMPFLNDAVAISDATMGAMSTNVTAVYPGAREGLQAAPWILYLIPGAMGLVATIVVLKRK